MHVCCCVHSRHGRTDLKPASAKNMHSNVVMKGCVCCVSDMHVHVHTALFGHACTCTVRDGARRGHDVRGSQPVPLLRPGHVDGLPAAQGRDGAQADGRRHRRQGARGEEAADCGGPGLTADS